jgi:hypothetical protein
MEENIEIKKKRVYKTKTGRPWFDGKDINTVLAKLEEATAIDASVEECLFYADISKDSYYRYLEANPDFRERLLKLREKPVMLARKTIVSRLNEPEHAKWYIERKAKKEFSSRSELTGADGKAIEVKTISGMKIIKENDKI